MADMKIGIVSDGKPKIGVADTTRKEVMERIKHIKGALTDYYAIDDESLDKDCEALDFAISDMERVEKFEAYFEDKDIAKRILTDDKEFSAWLERIKFHVKKADEYARKCEKLEAENKRLKDGIEKVKAKIDNSRTISLTYNTALDECLNIIDEHLGEGEGLDKQPPECSEPER